jgi:diguanylate cyclase (GGDEF)-like protein
MANDIIELGLVLTDGRKASQVTILSALLDRLLDSLGESALDAGEMDAGEFRDELKCYRQMLAEQSDPKALENTARRCLERCHHYFAGFQDYLVARDLEFSETIDVLRAALSKVVGDAEGTNKSLDESSRKFKRLTGVSDIRDLRRQLSKAVVDLESVVEEKRRKDEEQHAKLSKQIAQLESKIEASVAEALRDPLTGVANRRGFDQTSRRWFASCSRTGRPLIMAIIDLDHFKKVNDHHGHAAGDQILRLAAKCLKSGIRSTDFLGRYGGEEFVILLRDIDRDLAVERMQETLAKIAACQYEYHGVGRRVIVTFTASVGLTAIAAGEDLEVTMKRADDALYEAKAAGRNRVIARFVDVAQAVAS